MTSINLHSPLMHLIFVAPPIWIAAIYALLVSGSALGLKWLTLSGAISTAIVGFLVFWLGGGDAVIPLVLFLVSSSLLSVLAKRSTRAPSIRLKSESQRDARQVLANGGAAVLLVITHRILATHVTLETNRVVQIVFLAAIATVNSDTWASEIGTFVCGTPILLSNWRKAPPGTSGAVSFAGTVAALLGALFIPVCVFKLWDLSTAEFVAAVWAAFLGCLLDSILGAGLQAQYRDPDSGTVSEHSMVNGHTGKLVRGKAFIDNNFVNLAASIAGAFFCWILLHYGLKNIL